MGHVFLRNRVFISSGPPPVLFDQTLTSKIKKTYAGFGLILPIMNCSFWLNRLELPVKSHFCENSLQFKPILDSRPVMIFRGQMCIFFASMVKRTVKCVLSMTTKNITGNLIYSS